MADEKLNYMEETSVKVEPENIIGIRFNIHDWYIAFKAKYISGAPKSDNDENSEVVSLKLTLRNLKLIYPHGKD